LKAHSSQLEAIEDEFRDSVAVLDQERAAIHEEYCHQSGCDLSDPLGGWSETEHQILVKVPPPPSLPSRSLQELKRAQTKGISRSRLTETLSSQLPSRSVDEISRREDWCKCMRSLSERRKLQTQKMETHFEEYLERAKSSLLTLRSQLREERLFLEERERHERARSLSLSGLT
jgi:hypothetical protein